MTIIYESGNVPRSLLFTQVTQGHGIQKPQIGTCLYTNVFEAVVCLKIFRYVSLHEYVIADQDLYVYMHDRQRIDALKTKLKTSTRNVRRQ